MKISDLFKKKNPVVSFEIFPPKPNAPFEPILDTITALEKLEPDFISVTYGAGGSTKGRTVEIAEHIKKRPDSTIESLAHLTCITSTAAEVDDMLQHIKSRGITNILALRGDMPADSNQPAKNIFAKDLIKRIHKIGGFCIAAAAYPEGHPECPDRAKEYEYLKEKIGTGVDFLISQIFFDNRFFYELREKMAKDNIDIPFCAGIMPVFSKSQIEHICSLCGTSIPDKVNKMMEKYGHENNDLQKAGLEYACQQIEDLCSNQVRGIHLYTMNRPLLAKSMVEDTKLR